MNRKTIVVCMACLLIALATLPGCAKTVTTGAFDGQTYSNDFFKLSLVMPQSWHIAGRDELMKQFGVSKEQVGLDDKQEEEALGLGQQKVLYLLYAGEYPAGHTGSFNTNVSLICENLKLSGNKAKSAMEYLNAAVDKLDKAALQFKVDETDEEKVGSVKTASLFCELSLNGVALRQRHIAAIKNGYALLLTLTYPQDASVDELNTVQGIADSLKFN